MHLLLIPTALERELISAELKQDWTRSGNAIELCGFGPFASGVLAMRWIHAHRPSEVILLGIAGSYSLEIPPGTAIEFERVSSYGVGVGSGEEFQQASSLGWQQWSQEPIIGDSIDLRDDRHGAGKHELLTVAAASSGADDVEVKKKTFPSAVAEDMEGFSVAIACKISSIPLRIIRGISNVAGQRDHREWRIEASLQAAMALLVHPDSE